METDDAFESAVHRHDAQVAELGLPIWVGSEPTFTDREAQTPAWLHAALGDDKELRARALLGTLSRLMPGALVLRSVGRLYPGEKLPRWNLGLLRRRDGEPLWSGPPDPLLAAEPGPAGPRTSPPLPAPCQRHSPASTGPRNALPAPRKETQTKETPARKAQTRQAQTRPEPGQSPPPRTQTPNRCSLSCEPTRTRPNRMPTIPPASPSSCPRSATLTASSPPCPASNTPHGPVACRHWCGPAPPRPWTPRWSSPP
ncbi:MAG: transglutaminase family protein [Comamonadaceae bacterium]|nr:transglutaminase family protein [Comamonadaceae bacterium]